MRAALLVEGQYQRSAMSGKGATDP